MVDLRLTPDKCEWCKCAPPRLIHRCAAGKETWVCWDCAQSLIKQRSDVKTEDTDGPAIG